MLVKDLRETIKKYSSNDKDNIIVELYKRIPKKVKEEYDIDNFIACLKTCEKTKKKEEKMDIESLEESITYFIKCVREDLYSHSNKIISKKERQNWRFKVKKYYKELNQFLPNTPDGERATDLLKQLYELLSRGSNYLLFSNFETFRAVGLTQGEFLEDIMLRKTVNGIDDNVITYCIDLLMVDEDPYGYYMELIRAFKNCLKTNDDRMLVIQKLQDKREEIYLKYQEYNKNRKSHLEFEFKEKYNHFIKLIVYIYLDLCEFNNGISYFKKHYIESDAEIKEYILLDILEDLELYNHWIEEYEKNVGKIDYRKSLKEQYQEFKKMAKKNI